MMKKKVLILDGDLEICKKLKYALQQEMIDAYYTPSAEDALEKLTTLPVCLVIMDILIGGCSRISILQTMRRIRPIPILVISSSNLNSERVAALRAGASAIISKPFVLEECVECARSLMKLFLEVGTTEDKCHTLTFGLDFSIDPTRRQVLAKDTSLVLTRSEFELLYCMARHAGQVLSRDQLYAHLWKFDGEANVDSSIKTHIGALRKKLAAVGCEYITNVWGVGYRFEYRAK